MSRHRPRADGLGIAAAMAALAIAGFFGWILGDVVARGAPRLSLGFLLDAPRDAGRAGGIAPILVATAGILLVCMAVALPLGLGAAVYLAEVSSRGERLARIVRRSLDVLAGVPSIVFGLFGNAFFCVALGLGFSIVSGGLTLACMVLPVLIRTAEEGLRAVPQDTRHGAAALGLSRGRALTTLLLPAAAPALLAGLVLGIGRAVSETAALLFTSGYVDRMPRSLLDSGRALSIHVYDLSMNIPGGEGNAYASALVLVLLLAASSAASAWISRRWEAGRPAA